MMAYVSGDGGSSPSELLATIEELTTAAIARELTTGEQCGSGRQGVF